MIDTNSALTVVDVREANEYCGASGHIPGALNYPWISGVLQKDYTELAPDAETLVVCQSGHRSDRLPSFLIQKFFSMSIPWREVCLPGRGILQPALILMVTASMMPGTIARPCPILTRRIRIRMVSEMPVRKKKQCPAESLYGEDSEEVQLLREFRDSVLQKTRRAGS